MPNWCENVLEISHEDPRMMDRLEQASARGRILTEFIPCPSELHITAGRSGNALEQTKIELQEQFNLKKFGHKNWYDWQVEKWGTKWDIGDKDGGQFDRDTPTQARIVFESAWSPPVEGIRALCQQHGFTATMLYYEGGENYCGKYDSEEDTDDFYSLGNYATVEELEAAIPKCIDEQFCLSQQLDEWLQEQEAEEEDNDFETDENESDNAPDNPSANNGPSL